MNKEELLKQYDEKAKVLRDEFIAKLEDDKKEFEVELPEDGEKLYFIRDLYGTVSSKIFNINTMSDIKRFENGLYFETEEEAKQHLKECKLLFTIKKWAKEKNDGWVPDWNGDKNNKYYIQVDLKNNRFVIANTNWFSDFQKLPFFKSEKIAQECIDLFGDEIKEVLVNGS